ARAVPADQRTEWSALCGLLGGGLGDAPGLAGAPPGALAGLAMLDTDLQTRFRAAAPAIPIGEALGAAVGAIAAEQPLLVALDDVQWLDRATLATLPALARDTAARPVLLLLGFSRGSPDGERLDELRARLGRDLPALPRPAGAGPACVGRGGSARPAAERGAVGARDGPRSADRRGSARPARVEPLAGGGRTGLCVRSPDRARGPAAGDGHART